MFLSVYNLFIQSLINSFISLTFLINSVAVSVLVPIYLYIFFHCFILINSENAIIESKVKYILNLISIYKLTTQVVLPAKYESTSLHMLLSVL